MLVDTSVAVALLLATHAAHEATMASVPTIPLGLSGHALFETFSVLTRMPDRLSGQVAWQIIEAGFPDSATYEPTADDLREMASLGLMGGQVYDGLVALAARNAGRQLLSRDHRAIPVYRAIRADVVVLP